MTTSVELKCPRCGAVLAMEDVNMATDMALCRACNQISRFSDLVQEEGDEDILDSVPRRMEVVKTARGLEVTYRKLKGPGFFFLFFSLVWNAITYGALSMMLGKMTHENLVGQLFLIPFVLVGLGTFLGAVYFLFGRMTLTLAPGRGELFRGVGNMGRRQQFFLAKDSRISIEPSNIQQNHRVLEKIVVEQPGRKPFEFGTGIAETEAQRYVAAILRQMRA